MGESISKGTYRYYFWTVLGISLLVLLPLLASCRSDSEPERPRRERPTQEATTVPPTDIPTETPLPIATPAPTAPPTASIPAAPPETEFPHTCTAPDAHRVRP